MSKVTPIRGAPERDLTEKPIDRIHQNLLQASAIADLVMCLDDECENLDTDSLSNAMWAIKDRIEAARHAADVLQREVRSGEKEQS